MKRSATYVVLMGFSMLLAGCGIGVSSGKLKSKAYGISLKASGNSGGTLEVRTANKGCKVNQHNGCMYFPENTVGLIKFYVQGGRNNSKTCATGARNVITKIELTATPTGNPNKGDFTVFPLPDWVRDEAFPAVKLDTGLVYSEPNVNQATNQVSLLNINANDPALGDKTFWYRITAQNCTNHAFTWVTDPRGRNGGTR